MPRVLITGANRGIGLEFTRQFAAKGWEVIVAARNPFQVKEFDELQIEKRVALDVTSEESIQNMVKEIGKEVPIDLLINNAGLLYRGTYSEMKWERMMDEYRVNALGPFFVTRELIENLKLSSGSIVKVLNMSSQLGSITMNTSKGHGYRASKAALNMLSSCMALDLKEDNICSIVVHPGYVRTEMTEQKGEITPAQSVASLIPIIENMKMEDSGKLFRYSGEEMPW